MSIDEKILDYWLKDTVPELCQQFGCNEPVATYCPLCRGCFCHEHDQLTPVRRHDCLKGRAEAA